MGYRLLADLVMLLHGALLVFFVIGGFLAWRWVRLIWVHLAIVVWNVTIVVLDFGGPVTAVEKWARREGGEAVYGGGYIAHYLDGPVWPQGYTWMAERIGFVLVLTSYAGLIVIQLRRRRRTSREVAA
jgi:hypothetical protein